MKQVVIGFVVVTLLCGCSNKEDANAQNFGVALSRYFEKKGGLCLGPSQWPVEVNETDLLCTNTRQAGTAKEMRALERVGLVTATVEEYEQHDGLGRVVGQKSVTQHYQVAEAGKKFYREKEKAALTMDGVKKIPIGRICYGTKTLDKIVKWEGPFAVGDTQGAGVTYTYQIKDLAEWATTPEIRAAFPAVAQIIAGAGKQELEHSMILTSDGWEAEGLDFIDDNFP